MNTDALWAAALLLRTAEFPSTPDTAPEIAALIGSRHLLANWLDTEAKSNAGDEVHDQCTARTCTLVAAVEAANDILRLYGMLTKSDGPSATEPQVSAEPSTYEVSVLPIGDINRREFTLLVERKRKHAASDECWIVHDGHTSYGANARPIGHVLDAVLFNKETALDVAKRAAPNMVCMGSTATEIYWRYKPSS